MIYRWWLNFKQDAPALARAIIRDSRILRRTWNRGWRRWEIRGRVPRWARLIEPTMHFCPEWDGLLISCEDMEAECCSCFPVRVYVIPLKSGMWRTVKMSERRYRRWRSAYRAWYAARGHRLAISPEMWMVA